MDAPDVAVQAPGCKSASQRALLLAALAAGESRLQGLSACDDTAELRAALASLGYRFADAGDGTVRAEGAGGPRAARGATLDAGLGASTLRFLLALLAASDADAELRAAPALRRRPHDALLGVLRALGARVEDTPHGFRVRSKGFAPGRWTVPVAHSSQPLSGLLLAGGAHEQEWVPEGAPVSRGYLDLTLDMLRAVRGADAVVEDEGVLHQRAGWGRGTTMAVPADASGVLFLAVAALLAQRPVALDRPWSPRHPDAAALDALVEAGWLEPARARLVPRRPAREEALVVDLRTAPDAGPALAVFGACVPGGVRLRHVARLRIKESDRVAGIARLVEACGGRVAAEGEDLSVRPGAPRTAAGARAFDPDGDHRLAMAAGVARLHHPHIEVRDPACVSKSFPGFWEQLERIA